MKNRIAAGIMLFAGSVAAIVCLIKRTSFDYMLLAVFFAMFIFMIVGFGVQHIFERLNRDAEIRLEELAIKKKEEEARIQAEKMEAEHLQQMEEIQNHLQTEQNADSSIDDSVIDEVLMAGLNAKFNASNK